MTWLTCLADADNSRTYRQWEGYELDDVLVRAALEPSIRS